MDGSLPSYEAAMREARAYLRRRDLSSQDEIPLYFAWQRLYAAANANLSTDFLQETRAELRARQEARLAPRRGIPPPLFTSFDKVHRTSAQASAFLRAGTSSDAAIEMMARRYRREAEKLRSSREKLLSSLDDAEKRAKKAKRQKSPMQEVDELLGSIERSEGLSDTDGLLSTKTVKGKLTKSSSNSAKRTKRSNLQHNDQELDSDDQLDASKVLPKSKTRVATSGKRGAGSRMDDFGEEDEVGISINPAKAAELRRSSLSRPNPAAIPSFSTDANVAAFTAHVADWRMPPDIDRASSAPELSQKGAAQKSTASGKRLSGANELRGSAPVEGNEADMTFDTSSGSSGLDEEGVDPDASFKEGDARVSPMSRHSTKREGVAKHTKDNTKANQDQLNVNKEAGGDRFRGLNATQKSEFHQKLLQLSHAVGDMQVKIQGQQIEFTFKGELDGDTGEQESKLAGKVLQSSIKSDETKLPFVAQKVSNTSGSTHRESDGAAEVQEEQANAGNLAKVQPQTETVNEAPRKQSNVRFADIAHSDDRENSNNDGPLTDEQTGQSKPGQQNLSDGSFVVPPVKYEGQPREIRTSSPHKNVSKRPTTTVGTTAAEENDNGKGTTEAKPLGERPRSGKPQQQSTDGEGGISRHEEENFNEGDFQTSADSTSDPAKSRDAAPISEKDSSMNDHQRYRRSPSRGQLGEQKHSTHNSTSESQDSHAIDTSDRRRKPSNLQTEGTDRSSNLQQQQKKGEEVHTHSDEKDFDDFDESDLRTDTSERAAIQESAEMNKNGELKRQENPSSHTEGAQSEQRRQRDDSVHDAKKSVQEVIHTRSDEDDRRNAQPPLIIKEERSRDNSQDTRHSHSEGLRRRRQENVHDATGSFQEGVRDRSDEEVDEGGFQTKSSDRAEIRASASKDDNSKGERQDNRRSQSKGPHREQVRQQKDEFQDSSAIQNSDVHRSDAIGRGRSQDAATRDERSNRGIQGFDKPKGNNTLGQTSRPKRDSQESSQRLYRTSTGTRGAARELKSRSSGRDLSASPPQKGAEYDAQSFSDASEDASDGSSNDPGTDSDDESIVQERDTSSKHMEQSRTERQKSSAHSSSREQSVQRTLAAKTERLRTSRPSRNEREEDPDTELSSDEELSDGPDTPHKRHVDPRRRSSDRHQSRVLGHRQEIRPRNDSKRISSRSKSSRRTLTHDKRRNYSPDSSNDSDATDKSDSDDHSQQSSDETPRSSSTHRSRSHHTSRTHRGTSIRYSTPESSRRSRHLTPDMDSLSKRSKPDVQFKRDGKSRSKTRASKAAYKLPEGIVWPPGMEKECIARLGLDGHHPIAPPGLEHLVTEEHWGDYWTWLHWYSSWQMWYMKNDKKPKRKSEKQKRSRRRGDADESLPIQAEHYYDKHDPHNANWTANLKRKIEPLHYRRERGRSGLDLLALSARESRQNEELETKNTQHTDESSPQVAKHTEVETIPVLPPTLSDIDPTHPTTENLVIKSYLVEKAQKRSHKRKISVFSELMAKLLFRDLPLLRSPRSIRSMEWRARTNFYLTNPEESHIGWRLHQLLMLVLFIDVGVMASETLDGPRYGSTDPDFPYMLSETSYNAIETLFSLLYIIEFLVRWSTAPKQDQFWKSISTWIRLLAAVAALPKLAALVMGADTRQAEVIIYNLRILRAVRLIIASYAFIGTKVLFRAVADAIPPLTISLFFLITVVMVFATAIFYAEPCYDLQTCTFTDIFNTGYFVMLTVATVGYGSQVPSMHNAGSLLLVCMVMIFGTIYFSMPLAIVGIKYELAWKDYDDYAKTLKQDQCLPIQSPRRKSSSTLSTQASRREILNAIAGTNNQPDDTLQKIDALIVKYASSITCDRFYKLSQGIIDTNFALQLIICPPENWPSPPMTLEAVIQSTKRRSDEASQALDGIMSIIKLHSRVCAEAHELVQASLTSTGQENDLDRFMSSGKLIRKDARSTTRMSRAKGKIAAIGSKAMKAITHHDRHTDLNNLRAQIWNIFEYRQDIWQARIVNKMRMVSVVLSIAMFYLQTTPELQKTGLQTLLCLRNVHDYCGRYDEPGCYVFREVPSSGSGISVEVTSQHLDFHCSIGDPDETCYGSGVNFASDKFPLSCTDVFSSSGMEHVCKNRLCNPPVQFLFDMEPYWIYFEFLFGFLFTLEIALHVYSHPVRRHLWGDIRFIVNILVLLPFYVEIVEILIGQWPTYSVVPAMPSFFTAIRFLKSLRILKLGTHIPGARVLIRTAQLVTERLAIPLFFLFLGCVVSAAVFFEMERGTECFVGTTCMWWHKNVLTPEMSEGLTTGKRLLVQNTLVSIITDMLRSTWFSLVSFTTVGYGDLHPRTSLGKLIDIVGMIFSSCYTAMPLTLVGGQFYICYELHAQEERMKKERPQARINPGKLNTQPVLQSMQPFTNGSISSRSNLPELPNTDPSGIAPIEDPNAVRLMTNSALSTPTTARDEEPAAAQPYTRLTEAQVINQFFLMQKVFHETIKDISLLNQLGMERVNTMRKKLSEAATLLADVRLREEVIETKISENMNFCITACLNFAGMIERILGTERARKPLPATGHTNALLAAADVTNELLQSAKSTSSRRSISGKFPDAMPRLHAKQTFKRMATVSKVLAGPQNRSGRANTKWAEYTNNQNQNQPQPE
ncbi:hypothetical protein PC121_g20003 [Phytophthora cactorum]|nr:hypothetical protein PC120_g15093 [Phytophthora cactorum]KAG3047534.1 hypothetical protein PC121_g20003 [Phytophthora cactorum]